MQQYLQDVNTLSILIRIILAIICGGILGVERGRKNHPAGFKTYILVCMGATIVMLTNQYILNSFGGNIDPSRMGAQVISGIGFLGAGTIMIIDKNKIKGLTTAAGLWGCACMGLAIGIGFYEGAIISCLSILCVVTILDKLDRRFNINSKPSIIKVNIKDVDCMNYIIDKLRDEDLELSNIKIYNKDDIIKLYLTITTNDNEILQKCIVEMYKIHGVISINQI